MKPEREMPRGRCHDATYRVFSHETRVEHHVGEPVQRGVAFLHAQPQKRIFPSVEQELRQQRCGLRIAPVFCASAM